jgi:hypothetical protein
MSIVKDAAHKGLVVKRRPSPQQGRALEGLGHAIEYLFDSCMLPGIGDSADMEAAHILMGLSMQVFEECEEVVPLGRRVRNWIRGLFPSPAARHGRLTRRRKPRVSDPATLMLGPLENELAESSDPLPPPRYERF